MQTRTVTLTQAQQLLRNLPEQWADEALVIVCNGRPALTLMSYQAHQALLANVQSLQTLLEIMLGGAQSTTPQPAHMVARPARSTSWEEFQREVGWD